MLFYISMSKTGTRVISMRDDFRTIYGDNVKKVPFTFDD